MPNLKMKKETVVRVFEALGYKTAKNWEVERLEKKVNGLSELIKDSKHPDIEDSRTKKALTAILKADKVIIDKPETEKVQEVEKKTEKKESVDVPVDVPTQKKPTQKKKVSKKKSIANKKTVEKTIKKISTKGPGVIATIIECLKKRPTTREAILNVLVKRFPDRDKSKMETTVKCAVPSYLQRKMGLEVKENNNGSYCIK